MFCGLGPSWRASVIPFAFSPTQTVRSNFSFIAPMPDGAALMIMESEGPWTYFQIQVLSVDRNARVPPSIEHC